MQKTAILTSEVTRHERVLLPKVTRHHVCNPSILVDGDRILAAYRGVNYDLRTGNYHPRYCGERVKYSDTQNYLAELDMGLKLQRVSFLEDRHIRTHDLALMGVQDLRLFHWQGRMFATGSAAGLMSVAAGGGTVKAFTMALLEMKGNFLQLHAFLARRKLHEKNWMPWIKEGELNFVYSSNPCEIIKLSDTGTIETVKIHNRSQGDLFGGTCVLWFMGYYIGILHRKQVIHAPDIGTGHSTVRSVYTHVAMVFDDNFSIVAVGREFSFEGQDVEFCSGLAFHEQKIILSYGVCDSAAVILRLNALEFIEFSGIDRRLFRI